MPPCHGGDRRFESARGRHPEQVSNRSGRIQKAPERIIKSPIAGPSVAVDGQAVPPSIFPGRVEYLDQLVPAATATLWTSCTSAMRCSVVMQRPASTAAGAAAAPRA